MTVLDRGLLALVEYCVPDGLGANLAGDLEEEAREFGQLWLVRECLRTLWHGITMRSRRSNLLESSAAVALLFAIPLTLLLALRRFVLVLVPYRESAELSGPALALLAAATAILAVPLRRQLALCLIAVFALPFLFVIPMPLWQRGLLVAAVWAGAAVSKRMRREEKP